MKVITRDTTVSSSCRVKAQKLGRKIFARAHKRLARIAKLKGYILAMAYHQFTWRLLGSPTISTTLDNLSTKHFITMSLFYDQKLRTYKNIWRSLLGGVSYVANQYYLYHRDDVDKERALAVARKLDKEKEDERKKT